MLIRLKITLVFSAIVFCILGLVCIIVYYFSYANREKNIGTRLTNVAITTGRFLSRAEIFNPLLIQKIDSLTAIAFTHKTVQAYDQNNRKIYSFNDDDEDTLAVSEKKLDKVRKQKKIISEIGNRDVVFYHYTDQKLSLVIVTAGFDVFGRQNLNRL